ncbi:hypothetical protein KSF78_0004346 [Schistosoma japonicum]|nr:hypothetical protein KSF78_0004346 [Schistosoma japonicum]
MRFSISSNLLA